MEGEENDGGLSVNAGEVDMGDHGLDNSTPRKKRHGRYSVIRPASSKKKQQYKRVTDVDWTQLQQQSQPQQPLVITVSDATPPSRKPEQRRSLERPAFAEQLARCVAKQEELRAELRRLVEMASSGQLRSRAQVLLEHLTLGKSGGGAGARHDRSKSFILVSGQVHVPADVDGVFAPRNSPPRKPHALPFLSVARQGNGDEEKTQHSNKTGAHLMHTPSARHRPNKSIVLFPSGTSLQQLLEKPEEEPDVHQGQGHTAPAGHGECATPRPSPSPAKARWKKAVKTISGLRHIIRDDDNDDDDNDGEDNGNKKGNNNNNDRRKAAPSGEAPTPKKQQDEAGEGAASAPTPPRCRRRPTSFDSVIKHVYFFQYEHEPSAPPVPPRLQPDMQAPLGLTETAFPPPDEGEAESLSNLWLFAMSPGPLMQRVSHVEVTRMQGKSAPSLPPPPPYDNKQATKKQKKRHHVPPPPILPYQTRPSFLNFVLTDIEGNRLFASSLHYYELRPAAGDDGGLLYAARSFVVLSHYPFHTAFHGLLGEMHRLQTSGNLPVEQAREWLELITQELVLPVPGGLPVRFPFGSKWFECALPSGSEFPLLDVDVYDTLFRRLSVDNIMTVFVAMLTEQRILFHSNQHARLCPIAECFHALLFPFRWYHVFIPVLPAALVDLTDAPVPYVIGVHSSSAMRLSQATVESVYVVDIDNNTVRRPSAQPYAPTRLPPAQEYDLRHALRTILDDHHRKPQVSAAEWQFRIRSTFFQVFPSLLRHYRKHMFFLGARQSYPIFNAETFLHGIESRNPDARDFLSYFLSSQLFAWFLENSDHTSCFHDIISNDTFTKTSLVSSAARRRMEPFVIERAPRPSGGGAPLPPPPPYSPGGGTRGEDVLVVTSSDSTHKSVVHLKRKTTPVWARAARLSSAARAPPRDFTLAYQAQAAAMDAGEPGALPLPSSSSSPSSLVSSASASSDASSSLLMSPAGAATSPADSVLLRGEGQGARGDVPPRGKKEQQPAATASQLRRLSSGANILATHRNECEAVAGLQELLAKVFLGERIPEREKADALAQLDKAYVRQRLVRVLSQQNQFQGKVRLTKWSFAVVREFVETLLTLSHRAGDYATAKLVFSIGSAFYVEEEMARDYTAARQTFLEKFIAQHKVSEAPELWETFYQEDVVTVVRACKEESDERKRETVVQCASSLINTMLTYGVEKRLVIRLVHRVASEYELSREDKELLEVLVLNLSMALSLHNESLAKF